MTLLVSSWEAGLFCHVLWRNVTGNVMAWLHPGMFLTLCWPYSYRSPSFGFLLPSFRPGLGLLFLHLMLSLFLSGRPARWDATG